MNLQRAALQKEKCLGMPQSCAFSTWRESHTLESRRDAQAAVNREYFFAVSCNTGLVFPLKQAGSDLILTVHVWFFSIQYITNALNRL